MNFSKIAFIVDEAAINTFESEYILLPLFRNLLRENAQVEIFACKDGELEDLCARVDAAEAIFCYSLGEGNTSAAVRYAEEIGKEVLHLEPTEEELKMIRAKRYSHLPSIPGVMFVD